MSCVIIDYTLLYFASLAGTPVPPVVIGKFVQVRHGPRTYVVFSPKAFTKYHSHIVERFCGERGLDGSWDVRGERFAIDDASWQIIGGGKFDRDAGKKLLRLYGDSQAYGKFDGRGLRDMLTALPDLADYAVIIE